MRSILLALAIALIGTHAHAESGQARITGFNPTGTTKKVQQVKVRFSTHMVPLSDPRGKDPFTAQCTTEGKGRWIDTRNWAYEFPHRLGAGQDCTFTPIAGLHDLNGDKVVSAKSYSFNTGGPSILRTRPWEGSRNIARDQYFGLWLDAAVEPHSVEENAWCDIQGLSERVPVRIVHPPKTQPYLGPNMWLTCDSTLPANAKIRLIWDKGIRTQNGIATKQRQVIEWQTRPDFHAQFTCERTKAQDPCMPLSDMWLNFSTPIERKAADTIHLVSASGDKYASHFDDNDPDDWVSRVQLKGPFPPDTQFQLIIPDNLQDDSGRILHNADKFPLSVRTGDYPPLVKFPGRFGVLEQKEGGILPVAIRGVEDPLPGSSLQVSKTAQALTTKDPYEIFQWLNRLERVRNGKVQNPNGSWSNLGWGTHPSIFNRADKTVAFSLPDGVGKNATEVVGIPLSQPGMHVVQLESKLLGQSLLGKDKPYFVSAGALVTNMSVHFLWGMESSLVWVTALDTGKPVGHAQVQVLDPCKRKVLWEGKTDNQGRAKIGNVLPQSGAWGMYCSSSDRHALMVTARKDADMSFTFSSWNNGLQPYEFDIREGWENRTYIAHAVTDRSLFRAGETMSAKIFVRHETQTGLDLPSALPRAATLVLFHQGSGKTIQIPLTLDADYTALANWDIPQSAKLGIYSMTLETGDEELDLGEFSVQEYKVPTMQGFLSLPKAPITNADQSNGSLQVRYLAGGVASGQPVRISAQLKWDWSGFSAFKGYSFDYQPIEEGTFPSGQAIGPSDASFNDDRELTLGPDGKVSFSFSTLPHVQRRRVLAVEAQYADANGETYVEHGSMQVWPAKLALGIKTEGWAATQDDVKFTVLALDTHGKPMSGQKITVNVFKNDTLSHRKRMVGGFYAYDNQRQIKKMPQSCSGTTDSNGRLRCHLNPDVSGEIILQARAQDPAGNKTTTTKSIWLVGKDEWWFDSQKGDRMDILMESAELEPGNIARVQVRSPFRKAMALVALEREGVVDSFVTPISGREPVIRFPVKASYAPNMTVSVLAVRGRVNGFDGWMADKAREYDWPEFMSRDGGAPTGTIDLSKPAFKLGMTQFHVGRKGFKLDVEVKPEQSTYRIRQTAKVDIHVQTADGRKLPEGTEVAIAAVDKGLLALMPNKSWNLLNAMLKDRPLSVYTSTSQMQVVGKRHYGRKAVAPGGGGANDEIVVTGARMKEAQNAPPNSKPRELFDTLLLWQGRVQLDAAGNAKVDVPINDSLTQFRVVAVADAGADRFGTGTADFTVTQPIQLISALPPVIREGDQYKATFTIRNTTETDQGVTVFATISTGQELPAKALTIPALGLKETSWDVTAPLGKDQVDWQISVQNSTDPSANDAMKVSQKILPAIPVRVMQATIDQVKTETKWPVSLPADALPGRGGVEVRMQSTITGNLTGVTEYMRKYPYGCFEQKTSKALALQDKALWARNMRTIEDYLDSDGLLQYFPTSLSKGSDILTAYVLKTAKQVGWDIPEHARNRMLDALQGFVDGKISRTSPLQTNYKTWRQISALAALSVYGRGNWQMQTAWDVNPDLLPTPVLTDWILVVGNLPKVPDRAAKKAKALEILQSRLVLQGTSMNFATDNRLGSMWWLMENADTANARAMIALLDDASMAPDAPRLVRGLLSRMQDGRWRTTTANAWGVLAINDFSMRFEQSPVTGTAKAILGKKSQTFSFAGASEPEAKSFPPAAPGKVEELTIRHDGEGSPWAIVTASSAIPLKEPLSAGYTIERSLIPVEQKFAGTWHVGDVVRVHINVHALSDMTWVVVDDPVPAGATILGKGFANESTRLTQGQAATGVWPSFTEAAFDAWRGYYRYVPAGDFSVEYTMRLNTAGTFQLPPSRVEAMYKPEQFAELPVAEMTIAP